MQSETNQTSLVSDSLVRHLTDFYDLSSEQPSVYPFGITEGGDIYYMGAPHQHMKDRKVLKVVTMQELDYEQKQP